MTKDFTDLLLRRGLFALSGRDELIQVYAEAEAKDRQQPRRSLVICTASVRGPSEALARLLDSGRAADALLLGPAASLSRRLGSFLLGKALYARPRPQHSVLILLLDELPAWLGPVLSGAASEHRHRLRVAVALAPSGLQRPTPSSPAATALLDWAAGLLSGDAPAAAQRS
jgi:hypothetical protein